MRRPVLPQWEGAGRLVLIRPACRHHSALGAAVEHAPAAPPMPIACYQLPNAMAPDPDVPDEHAPALLGRWRLLRADATLDFAPGVSMDFRSGGRLLYGFDVGDRRETVRLIYRVDGNELHTDNPATTHEVSTHFAFGEGGVLILDFAGARAWFVREF